MIFILATICFVLATNLVFFALRAQRFQRTIAKQLEEIEKLRGEGEAHKRHYEAEAVRIYEAAKASVEIAQREVDRRLAESESEFEKLRNNQQAAVSEAEAKAAQSAQISEALVREQLQKHQSGLAELGKYYQGEISRHQGAAEAASQTAIQRVQAYYESEVQRMRDEAAAAFKAGEALVQLQIKRIEANGEEVRAHYQSEARKVHEEANAKIEQLKSELESLKEFQNLAGGVSEARQALEQAMAQATELRAKAQELLAEAKIRGQAEKGEAAEKAKEIRHHAETVMVQATRDAGRIVANAQKEAESVAGDAYRALREKDQLDRAVVAIRNVVEGYGDRYIIPTRSVIDDLAADFGHTEAGQALAGAREHTRRMVEAGEAARCEYAEANRRETAVRFVTDAFNGRVDAILSRSKHDNFGSLEQEIRDAFALVNLNGSAFREAQILPAYLEARMAELRWAVVAHELRLKEREEQRRIKEQMREEEKARREYEKAMQEAQREEEVLVKALERARIEAQQASHEQRAKLEQQISLLSQKLVEAEAKNQRAISMAQQTRKGNVYIISNIGSFGEDVIKIGMTRRLEPMDRIKELSDASVPFEFDVHAVIPSDDAPRLENLLHVEFERSRVNQVNYRKEFFKLSLERIREFIAGQRLEASFTLMAEAKEFRESKQLLSMSPEQREKYWMMQEGDIQRPRPNQGASRDVSNLPFSEKVGI